MSTFLLPNNSMGFSVVFHGVGALMWYFGRDFLDNFYQFSSGQKWLHFAQNLCNKWYQNKNSCNNLFGFNHNVLRPSKNVQNLNRRQTVFITDLLLKKWTHHAELHLKFFKGLITEKSQNLSYCISGCLVLQKCVF